ncbi:MAG: MFS transporter [Oscillospiraceae bacterium]|nr:MFS transporter [Oscillospiraceae bacterium]
MGESVLTSADTGAQAPIGPGSKRYVKPREIVSYALTSYGQKNLNGYINSSRPFFLLNFFGITGEQFAYINFASILWDALDDPLQGIFIDRCRTRWGRLRPFLILPLPFWAVTSVLFYVVPGSMALQTRAFYMLALTIINGVGLSLNTGWELLLYNMSPNTNERGTIEAARKFMELFTYLPSLVKVFVDNAPKWSGYKITQGSVYLFSAELFTALAVATSVYGFYTLHERIPLSSKEQLKENSIFKSFRLVFNRPLMVLMLSGFFGGVKSKIGEASEDFFWLNCTGKLSNGFLCSLFTGLPSYAVTPATPKLIRKFGVRSVGIFSGLFGAAGYLILYIVGYKPTKKFWVNFTWITFILTVAGVPNSAISICGPMLKGDMFDYLEWKTGVRSEGIVNALQSYMEKLSSSVLGLISGLVFKWIKFTPKKDKYENIVPHTDKKILSGLFTLFALAPAIARLGYGLSLLLFNVHGKFKERMLYELQEKRKTNVMQDS